MKLDIIAKLLKMEPRTLLEVGAGPRLEMPVPLLQSAEKIILIDPIKENILKHEQAWNDWNNPEATAEPLCDLVTANFAIVDDGRTEVEMRVHPHVAAGGRLTGRSFIEGSFPPLFRNERLKSRASHWKTRKVPAAPMSQFDDGRIDVAVVDAEGSDLAILKTLTSVPMILKVETPPKSPNNERIFEWAKENSYFVAEEQKNNTIFIQQT